MLPLQELSDRVEIQDLLARYSFAIDDKDWNALDRIFTPDAHIDYSAAGGAVGSLARIKAWLPDAMARFPRTHHMVATTKLDLDGDRATSRTMLFNPMVYAAPDGAEKTFFIGLFYRDVLVRTADGWRIHERVEELTYTYDVPDMPPIPAMAD
ncbi:MAG: nuclear transport factor 2 family protein [Novosphingobium sp.]